MRLGNAVESIRYPAERVFHGRERGVDVSPVGIHLKRHLGALRAVHTLQVTDQLGQHDGIGPALHEQHRHIGDRRYAGLIGGEHLGQRADRLDAVPAVGVAHRAVVEPEEGLEHGAETGFLDDSHLVNGLGREIVLKIEIVVGSRHGERRHDGEALRRGADSVHQTAHVSSRRSGDDPGQIQLGCV